jgi:hypothetical protein
MADSLMHVLDPAAKLIEVSSDNAFTDGSSFSWAYKYATFTDQNQTYYFVRSSSNSVVLDSLNNIPLIGISYITYPWIDSDSALALAEAQGGAGFRILHPHYRIVASISEAVVPNPRPYWYIEYIDIDNSNTYQYIFINATDSSKISNVPVPYKSASKEFALLQNYPNPFNPATTISYTLQERANITINIYNSLGQKMTTLYKGQQEAGSHTIQWNAKNMASGIYFYELQAEQFSAVQKMLLLK